MRYKYREVAERDKTLKFSYQVENEFDIPKILSMPKQNQSNIKHNNEHIIQEDLLEDRKSAFKS